ncbi:MAG: hypothetical protein R2747_14065 [Pyrinomonadaceae bacterium]
MKAIRISQIFFMFLFLLSFLTFWIYSSQNYESPRSGKVYFRVDPATGSIKPTTDLGPDPNSQLLSCKEVNSEESKPKEEVSKEESGKEGKDKPSPNDVGLNIATFSLLLSAFGSITTFALALRRETREDKKTSAELEKLNSEKRISGNRKTSTRQKRRRKK